MAGLSSTDAFLCASGENTSPDGEINDDDDEGAESTDIDSYC